MVAAPRKAREIGPYSKPHTLAKLDQRTKEAALLRRIRSELSEHVGGRPSATQAMLIERLAKVSLRLELYDRKFALGEPITDHDSRTFAALHTAYRLMLKQLGMRPASATPLPWPEVLAGISQRQSDAA